MSVFFTRFQPRLGVLSWLVAVAFLVAVWCLLPTTAEAKNPDKPQRAGSTYEYVSRVFDRLRTHWEGQAFNRQLTDSLLTFVLSDNGTVMSVHLETAHDDNGSGEQAAEFVRQNAPYGPFPSSIRGAQLEFKFKLTPGSLQMLSYNTVPQGTMSTSPLVFGAGRDHLAHVAAPLHHPMAPWGEAGSVTTLDEQMERYIQDVQQRIGSRWQWEGDAPNKQAVVWLAIDRNGYLMSAMLKKSSGNRMLDRAAVRAIHQASPFQPVPNSLRTLPLEIEYVFEPPVSPAPEALPVDDAL